MSSLETAFQSPEGQATGADAAILAANAPVHSMVYELEEAWSCWSGGAERLLIETDRGPVPPVARLHDERAVVDPT